MSTAALAAPAAERSLRFLAREVALSAPGDQLDVLRKGALALQPFVKSRALSAGDVIERIFEIAIANGLGGTPGSDAEAEIMQIARAATEQESAQDVATRIVNARAIASDFPGDRPPPEFVETIIAEPDGPEAYGLPIDGDRDQAPAPAAPLPTVCPPAWRDLPLEPMRWLATHRIPAREPTILGGDGGGGKTTVALQLAVAVERGLGDWLGTTCELWPGHLFQRGRTGGRNAPAPRTRGTQAPGSSPPTSRTCIFISPIPTAACSACLGGMAPWRRRRYSNPFTLPRWRSARCWSLSTASPRRSAATRTTACTPELLSAYSAGSPATPIARCSCSTTPACPA